MSIKKYRKIITCCDCGKPREVDRYSNPVRCRSCANSHAKAGKPCPARKRGQTVACSICGKKVWSRACENRKYCSKACTDEAKARMPAEPRRCLECGKAFSYRVKPHSNNSGNYCSLACRNISYTKSYRGAPLITPAKYTGWASRRKAFITKGNRFCFLCGKMTGRLGVHHIEPARVSSRHEESNLATVCGKCHSHLEKISTRLALEPESVREDLISLIKADIEETAQVHRGRIALMAQKVLRERYA